MRTIQTAAGHQNGKSRPPHSGIGRTRLMAIAERFGLVALILTSFLLGAFGALAGTWTPRVRVDDIHAGSLLLRTDDPG